MTVNKAFGHHSVSCTPTNPHHAWRGCPERGSNPFQEEGCAYPCAPYCVQQSCAELHVMHVQVASMMPSDEAEAPLEYQKGSIGAIAERYVHANTLS